MIKCLLLTDLQMLLLLTNLNSLFTFDRTGAETGGILLNLDIHLHLLTQLVIGTVASDS